MGCCLILFTVFLVQKLLSLIKSHLFTFALISIMLGNGSKRILHMYPSVHCSIIYNSQDMEAIEMSPDKWLDKGIYIYIYFIYYIYYIYKYIFIFIYIAEYSLAKKNNEN